MKAWYSILGGCERSGDPDLDRSKSCAVKEMDGGSGNSISDIGIVICDPPEARTLRSTLVLDLCDGASFDAEDLSDL